MPVILRLERPPAARTPVLEAAAAAALAVCLDPRAEPGGEWHEAVATWVAARIRKIARRARGAHWAAVQELPGVTVDGRRGAGRGRCCRVRSTRCRRWCPGCRSAAPTSSPTSPGRAGGRRAGDLGERGAGADGGQGGGAGRARLDAVRGGARADRGAAVRGASGGTGPVVGQLCRAVRGGAAVAVRDAGFTEVAPGTITCIATGCRHASHRCTAPRRCLVHVLAGRRGWDARRRGDPEGGGRGAAGAAGGAPPARRRRPAPTTWSR